MKAKTTVFLWVLSLVVTIVALCISEWLAFIPLVAFAYLSGYMNKNIKRFLIELKLID